MPIAEQLGWGEEFSRQMVRATDFPEARRWSRILFAVAFLTIVSHTIFYFGTRGATAAWEFWVWFLEVDVVTTWAPCAIFATRRRLDPREREILLFWVGVSLGRLILFADRCPVTGEVLAVEVYRFFPAALVLDGVMMFAEGRLYWGRLYLLGLSELVVLVVISAGSRLPERPATRRRSATCSGFRSDSTQEAI